MPEGDAGDDPLEPRRLRASELRVLEIDVVDHVPDRAERMPGQPEPSEQDLEGAEVALVGEFGLEHVEPQLPRLMPVSAGIDEPEPRRRIDEAPDQPRA